MCQIQATPPDLLRTGRLAKVKEEKGRRYIELREVRKGIGRERKTEGRWEGFRREVGGVWKGEGFRRDVGGVWKGGGGVRRDMGGVWKGGGRG